MIETILEKVSQIENSIQVGGFQTHLVVFLISILLGMIIFNLILYIIPLMIERKFNVSHPMMKKTFRGIPTLWGILLGLYVDMQILTIPPRPLLFLQRLFHSIVILSVAILVTRFFSAYLKQKFQKRAGTASTTSILATTIDLAVYSIGILLLLESYGISISPLLTALGIGSVAVALALQDTLANLFSGINILVSKQFKVGDIVELTTGEAGKVVDMNWRNTTIKNHTDNMVIVPNKQIAASIIINYAQPFAECTTTVPVGVSYDSDLDYVEKITIEVAKETLQETEGGVNGFEPFVRYDTFADASINFNVFLRAKTVTDLSLIRHEFIKRLHARYQREGIIIPSPSRKAQLEHIAPVEE